MNDNQSLSKVFFAGSAVFSKLSPVARVLRIGSADRYLALPYTMFVTKTGRYIDSGQHYAYLNVGFSPEPIVSLKQPVYFLPLPNVHFGYGGFCCGNLPVLDHPSTPNLLPVHRKLTDWWFQSNFGTAVSSVLLPPNSGNFHTYLRDWESKTRVDPSFILKEPMYLSDFTFYELVYKDFGV